MKKRIIILIILFLILLATIVTCNVLVKNAAKGRLFDTVADTPHRDVGLLLGTSPVGRTGKPNQFFLRRIDATVALYEAGKIDRVIISGAKRGDDYDEPDAMKKALVARGIPDNVLLLDGEGLRTIESVVRTKTVFGENEVLVISQQFHNERALFLAKHYGLNAIAFNAQNTSSRGWRWMMILREYFARVKAVAEVIIE